MIKIREVVLEGGEVIRNGIIPIELRSTENGLVNFQSCEQAEMKINCLPLPAEGNSRIDVPIVWSTV